MLSLLAILVFPAAIGIAGTLAIRTFDESRAKIAAALGGISVPRPSGAA